MSIGIRLSAILWSTLLVASVAQGTAPAQAADGEWEKKCSAVTIASNGA